MADTRKSVLITGCSPGGIGNELARAFHSSGLRVFATARQTATIADLNALGIECLSLLVDNPQSVRACYAEVEKLVGEKGLDYLINNAGRGYTTPATELSIDEVRATFETNLFAVMDINKVFTPLILRSKGTFVHTGSVAGYMPYVWGSAYNASKAALHAYCNTLRVEMSPFGVSVIVLVVGGVKSNIARTERTLAPDSLFKEVQANFERRTKHSQEVGSDTRTFAQGVTRRILNSRGWLWNTRTIWAGYGSTTVWLVEAFDRYVPGGIYGFFMRRMFGLNVLGKGGNKKTV